eukprot:Platyproteum_vivax@DN6721_c0_g1_i1.p1
MSDSESDEDFDAYGFELQEDVGKAIQRYSQEFKPRAEKRKKRWQAFQSKDPKFSDQTKLKKLLRKGVPDMLRSQVWAHCLGSNEKHQRHPRQYEALLNTANDDDTKKQIALDLRRTFPDNRTYKAASGLDQLGRVLHAFSLHCPKVGYCQGLNFIAAILLLFMPEELAFWSLVQIVNANSGAEMSRSAASSKKVSRAQERKALHHRQGLEVPGYYQSGMLLLRADLLVLEELIVDKVPAVAHTFHEAQVQAEMLFAGWFPTLFCTCLPIHTTLRVWDTLFFEGKKVLFRTAISILKLHEEEIKARTSIDTLLPYIKGAARLMVDHNTAIRTAFRKLGKISRIHIETRSNYHYIQLVSEDAKSRQASEKRAKEREVEMEKKKKEEEEKRQENSWDEPSPIVGEEGSRLLVPAFFQNTQASPGQSFINVDDWDSLADMSWGLDETLESPLAPHATSSDGFALGSPTCQLSCLPAVGAAASVPWTVGVCSSLPNDQSEMLVKPSDKYMDRAHLLNKSSK